MPLLPRDKDSLDIRVRQALLLLLVLANLAAFTGILLFARPLVNAIFEVVNPFMVAIVVAYIFHPFASFMESRLKLSRVTGVLVTYSIIMTITLGFVAVLLPLVYIQFQGFAQSIRAGLDGVLRNGLTVFNFSIKPEEIQRLQTAAYDMLHPETHGTTVGTVAARAVDSGRIVSDILFSTLSGSLGFVAFISFVAVISFYFLLDYARVRPMMLTILGKDKEAWFFGIWAKVDKSLAGYLRGQLLVASIVGTVYGSGLMFLGIGTYAILIGFVAGVANLIPYIGPILGFIPAFLWVLVSGSYPEVMDKVWATGYILLLTMFVQALDGFVLHPRIAGQGAELHPLAIMLALIAGGQLGLGGMILAVPAAIMIRVLLEELWWKPLSQRRAREALEIDRQPTSGT
jgi:predicted PurR-regulated permease PerM